MGLGRIWRGIVREGIWCWGLQYAHDIALLARDLEEVQVMLDVVGKYTLK